MIGERFFRYLKPVPPRYMTRLNLFIEFLDLKIKDSENRARHITPNGYGSRLLTSILKLSDLDTLLTLKGKDIFGYLIPLVKDLEKPIDIRVGKHTTASLFVKSKTPCFELITPSRRENPILDIPIDIPYDDPKWNSIKPLRISDMGACDLRFALHSDYLVYRNHGPAYVVYSLDCLSLVCKFLAYYKYIGSPIDIDSAILRFSHSEVIVPALLEDSVAIWLRNTYKQQLILSTPLESRTSTIWDVITTDNIGTDFSGAMVDILHLKSDLEKQSISAQTAMSSLLIGSDKSSFTDYYRTLYTTTTTPDQHPYVWVDCLKNLSWWEFIIMVTSYVPDFPDSVSMQRDLSRDVRFWIMMKPWQMVSGSIPYKNMIRNRLEGLYDYLRNKP